MRIVPPARPVEQALPEWVMRPCWAKPTDELIPGGKAGLLKLADGQCYLVEPVDAGLVGHAFTMVKSNGELHLVKVDGPGSCSCPAFTYRRRNEPCKHIAQLRQALEQLQVPDAGPEGFDPFDGPDAEYDHTPPRLFLGDVVLFPGADKGPRPAA